jgi:hypothetical protein
MDLEAEDRKTRKGKRIMIDFDGVIHSYTSGWTGLEPVDKPVPGAKEFIWHLQSLGYHVSIFTTRALHDGGPQAVTRWLADHGFIDCDKIDIPVVGVKYGAELYIDDRAYRFNGLWDELYQIVDSGSFKPWHGVTK